MPGLPVTGVESADGGGALARGLVGLGLVVLGWGTRALGHWDEGRWWALEAVLVVVGGLLGLTGLVGAVGALGRVVRSKVPMTGTAVAAVALAVSGLALAGAGTVGGVDWKRLDVPAAWDRLELGSDGRELPDVDGVDVPRASDPTRDGDPIGQLSDEVWRTAPSRQPDVGDCLTANGRALGEVVDCDEPHRFEVVAVLPHREGVEHPDAGEQVGWLPVACEERLEGRIRDPELLERLEARVPGYEAWAAGDRRTACVLVWAEPVEGRQAP